MAIHTKPAYTMAKRKRGKKSSYATKAMKPYKRKRMKGSVLDEMQSMKRTKRIY